MPSDERLVGFKSLERDEKKGVRNVLLLVHPLFGLRGTVTPVSLPFAFSACIPLRTAPAFFWRYTTMYCALQTKWKCVR